jgi:hypothetical protein
MATSNSTSPTSATLPQPSTKGRPGLALIDKDSLYYSKERYRLIPQRTGQFTIQYLVIDTYENEIVGTHTKMSEAMDHRDRLDPVPSHFKCCEEAAHE